MCNKEKIKKIMKKYEVGKCQPSVYSFKKNGFYNTLAKKINLHFKNKNYHSNSQWTFKSIIQTFIYLLSFIIAFYSNYNFYIRGFYSILAGHMIIQTVLV